LFKFFNDFVFLFLHKIVYNMKEDSLAYKVYLEVRKKILSVSWLAGRDWWRVLGRIS
jgi:hypothetical protein